MRTAADLADRYDARVLTQLRFGWFGAALALACLGACGGDEDGPGAADSGTDTGTGDAATCEPFADPPRTGGVDCANGSSPGATGDAPRIEPGEGGYAVHRNLSYATRGGRVLQGDLFVPARGEGTPGVLVLVHGGGWSDCERRRDAIEPVALVYSLLGFPVFNIEYRLAPEGGAHPHGLADVVCAVQWLASRADEYGFDPARMAIMGESAGAHLALMAALAGGRDDIDPGCGPDVELALAVAFSAPADLPDLVANPAAVDVSGAVDAYAGVCEQPATGCETGRACDRCVDASPVAQACAGPADLELAVVHAPDPWDGLIPERQADRLVAALEAAGREVTGIVPSAAELEAEQSCVEGAAHGFVECLTTLAAPRLNPVLVEHLGER